MTRPPTSSKIIEAVCKVYGVCEAELLSKSRVRPLPEARRVCVILMREDRRMSYPEIASKMQYRSHASVFEAYNRERTDDIHRRVDRARAILRAMIGGQ